MHNSSSSSSFMTRRDLLAAGLAVAGGAAIAGGKTRAAILQTENGGYGPFKMGLQSYSLRGFKTADGKMDFETALAKTQELGIKYWESFNGHIPLLSDPKAVLAVKQKLDAHGVTVLGYGVIHFGKNADENKRMFDFGKMMGLRYFSADPDPESFDQLDHLVDQYQIAVGIHNHGPGHRYAKIDTIAAAVKDHHELIGLCNDTGHFLRSREDPVRAVEVFGKRTYGVHLKDVKDASKFTILGQGDLRLNEMLKKLADLHYNYCLALEYEENEKAPVDDIRACLAAAKKAAASL